MQLIWSLDFLNCAPFKLRSKVQIDKRITATLDHPKITSRHHNIDIMMAQQILTSVFYIFTGFLQKPESVRIQNSSLNVIFSNLLFLFSNWEQNSKNIFFEFANNDFENIQNDMISYPDFQNDMLKIWLLCLKNCKDQ